MQGLGSKKEDDYRREPTDIVDAAALQHDKDYDLVGAIGPHGALIDLKSKDADAKLVKAAFAVVVGHQVGQIDPYTGQAISAETAGRAGYVLGAFGMLVAQKEACEQIQKAVDAVSNIPQRTNETLPK